MDDDNSDMMPPPDGKLHPSSPSSTLLTHEMLVFVGSPDHFDMDDMDGAGYDQ